MDRLEALIQRATYAVAVAAEACRTWEDGGDVDPVSDTAWQADEATLEALEAMASIDPTFSVDRYPETRLGRLLMAARLLVVAGTDEGGQSADLEMAAQIFSAATDEA